MTNTLKRKIVLNKINRDSIKINKEKLYNDYFILKLSIVKSDDVKYYNIASILYGNKRLEELLKKHMISTYREDYSNMYMLLSKNENEYNINDIIELLTESGNVDDQLKSTHVGRYDVETNNAHILINLFLNSIQKFISETSYINSTGKCNYFLEKEEKNNKIRFLNVYVDKDLMFIKKVVTFMNAYYYFNNSKDSDKIKERQTLYNIQENQKDHFIKTINLDKSKLTAKDENIYVKRSYLNKNQRDGKANIRTQSYKIDGIKPEKNKIIRKTLNDFDLFFSSYISFNFITLTEDNYNLYTTKDLQKFKINEEEKIKDILYNKKIIFIDTINNDFSKKWIKHQTDILINAKRINAKGEIVTKDMFDNQKNLFCLNPENVIVVTDKDYKIDDNNAYYILVTEEKEHYSKTKTIDPYINRHNGYVIQTQNIKTSLKSEERKKRKNDKSYIPEFNIENYDVDINKDILRQTIFSLIIEDCLNKGICPFYYSEDLKFYKIYKLKNKETQKNASNYCLNINITSTGVLEKNYIPEDKINNPKICEEYKNIFSKYSDFYGNNKQIDCIIKWRNNLYTILSDEITAIPDYNGEDFLIENNLYLADVKNDDGIIEKSKKNINRKSNIVQSIWGGFYDLQTFILNDNFYYLPSPYKSIGAPINIQNSPVGRYIEPNGINLNKDNSKDLFENVLIKDFGSAFLNNLKMPSNLLGVKLLNAYHDELKRNLDLIDISDEDEEENEDDENEK